MKYTATVEIEFEADAARCLTVAHELMSRVLTLSSAHTNLPPPGIKADHYHIIEQPRPECSQCREIGTGMGPSHDGSKSCESGSIASGGKRSHCSCDVCF